MTSTTIVCFEDWTLHRASGELERAGERVRLQDLPFQILDELLSHPGEVVTREQLIARLWPKTVVDYEANLNSSVRRLRAVLNDDAGAPRYIETVPRRGYRYIGALPRPPAGAVSESIGAMPGAVSVAPELAGVAAETGSAVTAEASSVRAEARGPAAAASGVASMEARHRTWPRWAPYGLAIVVVAIGILIVPFIARRHDPDELKPPTPLRLAVLPFENLSPDPANAFFTQGLHEEILSTIANRAPYLQVISRTTMSVYDGAARPVRDIERDLRATHVLEGSVRREGRRVRLTLQLIDAHKDLHLWSKSFDRELADTIALQAEVASDVASQLAVKLSGNITQLPPPASSEAYDLYLQSRSLVQTVAAIRSPDVQLDAETLLGRAIALDPDFGAAYLERARIRLSKLVSSQDTSEENLRALRADLAAARKTMGDSPPLLTTEAQYALLVEFDSAKAMELLNTARATNANSSEALLYLARQLGSTGKPVESLDYFERAADLDPANPVIASDWAAALKMVRRPRESLRISREFDARYPGRITYGIRLFSFTGELDRFERDVAEAAKAAAPEANLAARYDLLLFSGELNALAALVEQTDLRTIPQVATGGFAIPAIGRKPVADLRGWVKLLQKDRAGAAGEGRAILDFVAHEPVTRWNEWYLRMLAAEGALLIGDNTAAAAGARQALMLAPRNVHSGIQRYAPALAAQVLAWAGAQDEAVTLLEQLATTFPALGPAEIVRDPRYAVPLAAHPRFAALRERLDAELAANRLEFP